MRPELSFETNPSGGRMEVIEMGGLAVEALAAMFLFIGSFGQPDMRLTGGGSFLERVHVIEVLLSF
jgi:hypothetical protein